MKTKLNYLNLLETIIIESSYRYFTWIFLFSIKSYKSAVLVFNYMKQIVPFSMMPFNNSIGKEVFELYFIVNPIILTNESVRYIGKVVYTRI